MDEISLEKFSMMPLDNKSGWNFTLLDLVSIEKK